MGELSCRLEFLSLCRIYSKLFLPFLPLSLGNRTLLVATDICQVSTPESYGSKKSFGGSELGESTTALD